MIRTLVPVLLLAAVAPAADAPISASFVTHRSANGTVGELLAAIQKQTGMVVEPGSLDAAKPFPADFEKVPFWSVLDTITAKTGTRLAFRANGRTISFAKASGPPEPVSVDGPFRVAVRQAKAVTDFETGQSYLEVGLEVRWEPRIPVFRIDSVPRIALLADDRSSPLTAGVPGARTAASGASYATAVRIAGVPRSATKLTKFAGSLTVTASPRMLTFSFPNLTSDIPQTQDRDGVSVTLKPVRAIQKSWETPLILSYPPGGPVFESFESWVTENRARLLPRDKTTGLAPSDYDIPEQGRRVLAVYRFTDEQTRGPVQKGWTLQYETPAPLVEFPVAFEFENLPLP